ncbi:unnamed protein product [Fraxinus pennsylvanica]|uniref:C2H2-type domain-containing protein n=1 Tax=Fraxinus pennsylvanica TaxID=56036 RepID=A0AAD1ZYZ1_9LAMI|nr:unnamed protein product [Fraxinus pennsylvanica]
MLFNWDGRKLTYLFFHLNNYMDKATGFSTQILRYLESLPTVSTTSGSSRRTHECSICHRRFPTDQVLGGHKRRHYEGGTANNNGAVGRSTALSSLEGVGSTVSHRNFDLNLPALPKFWPGFSSGEDEVRRESTK